MVEGGRGKIMMSGAMQTAGGSGMMEHEGQGHHHHHPTQVPPNHHRMHINMHMPMPANNNNHLGENDKSLALMDYKGTPKTPNFAAKVTSDEDEPSYNEDGMDSEKNRRNLPYPRMKWTDNMVRLLITVVIYVGEDSGAECNEGNNKRKSSANTKKGKWKTVSDLMKSKGCIVSPQQCEDKFNDLNKRYKKLNDILGRGTTCKVVESPSLLDAMNISEKKKGEARKILSSKHLFYKEMCAYHNGGVFHSHSEMDSHSSMHSVMAGKEKEGPDCSGLLKIEDEDKDEDNEEDSEDEDDGDDEDDGVDADDYEIGDAEAQGFRDVPKKGAIKPFQDGNGWPRSIPGQWNAPDILNAVLPVNSLQDTHSITWEQMQRRKLQLKEQKLNIQVEAFELEKRRFKWRKICDKRDRELERMKIENEKTRLENQKMALQLKQKEIEIEYRRPETMINSAATSADGVQGRDHNRFGIGQSL